MTRVGGETAWTSIEELFERTFGARSAAKVRETEDELLRLLGGKP